MFIALLILTGLIALYQIRGAILMSALTDKIATLTADVATLQTDVSTALDNAATPADLEALDAAHTNLQAVIASLTPAP